MRREVALALIIMGFLMASVFLQTGMARKPPKASLNVGMSDPIDDLSVPTDGSFAVSGSIQAVKGDAGDVRSYVQYSRGIESSEFVNVDGIYLTIDEGLQPQSDNLIKEEQYAVTWTISGQPGTYEIRIYSESTRAKTGTSQPSTVTIEIPPPPPGIFTATDEYQDS
ncbi:MAG: hypothetical protein KAQ65_08400, partial [Candidatus Thorarchaeota archaeon]|nr:hypothetical protein [Candidatus Thorarchaeota archaeon]